jgi:hypothetical protein
MVHDWTRNTTSILHEICSVFTEHYFGILGDSILSFSKYYTPNNITRPPKAYIYNALAAGIKQISNLKIQKARVRFPLSPFG